MLRTSAAKLKEIDLVDLKRPFTGVDWKSIRDMQVRGARHAIATVKHMRGDPAAERRNGVIVAALAAVTGAALMYLFDPGNGRSRRSSAGVRITRWYLSGRGQIDNAWHRLQTESPTFDLTRRTRPGADATEVSQPEEVAP